MRNIINLILVGLLIVSMSGCTSPRQFGQAIAIGMQDFSRRMQQEERNSQEERKIHALEDISSGVDDISWELRKSKW